MKRLRKYGKICSFAIILFFIALYLHLYVARMWVITSLPIDNEAVNSSSEIVLKEEPTAKLKEGRSEPPTNEASSQPAQDNLYGVIYTPVLLGTQSLDVPLPDYITDEAILQMMIESFKEVLGPTADWHSEWDACTPAYRSDRVFTVQLNRYTESINRRFTYYMYLNFDLETGKILYLNDILDVDELEKMMLVSGFFRIAEWHRENSDGILSQSHIDKHRDALSWGLARCSAPRDRPMSSNFYLAEDRIYFMDVIFRPESMYPNHIECYVELEDIRHILKIDID